MNQKWFKLRVLLFEIIILNILINNKIISIQSTNSGDYSSLMSLTAYKNVVAAKTQAYLTRLLKEIKQLVATDVNWNDEKIKGKTVSEWRTSLDPAKKLTFDGDMQHVEAFNLIWNKIIRFLTNTKVCAFGCNVATFFRFFLAFDVVSPQQLLRDVFLDV